MQTFGFHGSDIAADIRSKYGAGDDLVDLFAGNRGPQVHKWHHYIPIYEHYLERFRGTAFRFLEIGVSKGGSLHLWRNYFGAEAQIFGIDIDPACATLDGRDAQVRIGSQADPAFLARVIDEMGGIDVVLDDGSHQMGHIRASLTTLFPRLAEGGIYIIEDLHAAYWPRFGGGYGVRSNLFRDIPGWIDDMHVPYHGRGAGTSGPGRALTGIHVHDSIMVLDKGPVHAPVHSVVGAPA